MNLMLTSSPNTTAFQVLVKDLKFTEESLALLYERRETERNSEKAAAAFRKMPNTTNKGRSTRRERESFRETCINFVPYVP